MFRRSFTGPDRWGRPLKHIALAALLLSCVTASGACAEDAQAGDSKDGGVKPLFSYTGAFNAVVAGGRSQAGAYVHSITGGVQAPLGGDWSFTVQGGATAGYDLSKRVIGDVAGVQGPFNSGNALWLYELKATYETKTSMFQAGRIAAADSLPGVKGMDQFVNSAFSSNGGAIAINDPGRKTTPTSSWGILGRRTWDELELRGGAFLSDPNRMTLRKHGLDFSARTADGVLGFAEAVKPVGKGLRAGLGAFADSSVVPTFDGGSTRGDAGAYAWIERPPSEKGPGLSGFAMVQVTPGDEKNLQPLFLMAGATWKGLNARRPDDSVSLGATTGRFSPKSGLSGWETALEANYRFTLSEHLGVRPDVEYVIAPGGRGGGKNALVLGVQVEATL